MLCRCVLYQAEDKKVVDIRCHRRTNHKSGLCAGCREHLVKDKAQGLYKDRWGLAPRSRR
jgi:hypothetical protein